MSKYNVTMREVESSNLLEMGRDAEGTIFVRFKVSRSVYRYKGVPDALYQQWLGAESKGKFFNAAIRGKFDEKSVPDFDAE